MTASCFFENAQLLLQKVQQAALPCRLGCLLAPLLLIIYLCSYVEA
jgi:hypothetical protein